MLPPDNTERPQPSRALGPAQILPVVFYTAAIDVALLRSSIRFNEMLHPDTILEALLANEGPLTIGPWPPAETTERNKFLLMTLTKMDIYLAADDLARGPSQPQDLSAGPRVEDRPEAILAQIYARFPAVQRARESDGGPYRRCEFEASILTTGIVTWSYRIFPDGQILPGLENENAFQTFVRNLVRADLRERIQILTSGSSGSGQTG